MDIIAKISEELGIKNNQTEAAVKLIDEGNTIPFIVRYRKEMTGVYTTSVNEYTLDEAPMAYKSLEDIIDVIRESVDVIDVMKTIYNFKASD